MEMPDLEQRLFYLSERSKCQKIYQKMVSEFKGSNRAKLTVSKCHRRILIGKHAQSTKMTIDVV